MAGLVRPSTSLPDREGVDARHKTGHDGARVGGGGVSGLERAFQPARSPI